MQQFKSKLTTYISLLLCGIAIKTPQLLSGQIINNGNWKYINNDVKNAAQQISTGNYQPFTEEGPMHSLVLIHGMNGSFGTYIAGALYKLLPSLFAFQIISVILWVLASGIITDIALRMCSLYKKRNQWLILLLPMIEILVSKALTIPLSILLFTPLLIGLWYRFYMYPQWRIVPIEFGTVISLMLQANFRESLPLLAPFLVIIPLHWLFNRNKWTNFADILNALVMVAWLNINLWGSMYETNYHNVLYENRNSWQNPVPTAFIVAFFISAVVILFFAALIWHNLNKFEHKVIRFSVYLDLLSIPVIPWSKIEAIPKLGELFSYNDIIFLAVLFNIFIIAILIRTGEFIPQITKTVTGIICIALGAILICNAMGTAYSVNNHVNQQNNVVTLSNLENVPIQHDYHNLRELKREYTRHFITSSPTYRIISSQSNNDEQNLHVIVNKRSKVYLPILKYDHTKYDGGSVFTKNVYNRSELKAPTVLLGRGTYNYSANYQPDIASTGTVILDIITWSITILCWIGIETRYLYDRYKDQRHWQRIEQLRINYNQN